MNIIVTGGAGFIGRVVVRMLHQKGHSVKVIDSLVEQVHGDGLVEHGLPVGLLRLSVRYAASYFAPEGYWEDCDAVIHLAAEVGVGQSQLLPQRYADANATQTAALWERIVKTPRIKSVIVASSMSIYGEGLYAVNDNAMPNGGFVRPDPIDTSDWDAMLWNGVPALGLAALKTPEDKRPEPASLYAMTKYDAEMYSLILGKAYGVRTVALRFFNCLGPGQALGNAYTGVLAAFGCRALNEKPPRIWEDSRQSRDFIYVEDVARAVVHATEEKLSGVYNVGTGRATTVGELCDMVTKLVKSPKGEITGQYRSGDIRHCRSNSRKLENTGWKAQVSVEEAVARTVEWMKTQPLPVDRHDAVLAEMAEKGLVK